MEKSLTIDAIYQAMDALGPPVPRVQVCPSHYWPRVEDGLETLRFEAQGLASGTYLYRLEAQSAGDLSVQMGRFVLLK